MDEIDAFRCAVLLDDNRPCNKTDTMNWPTTEVSRQWVWVCFEHYMAAKGGQSLRFIVSSQVPQ